MKRISLVTILVIVYALFPVASNATLPTGKAVQVKQVIDTSFVAPSGCTIQRFRIHSPSMQREIKVAVVLPPSYLTDKGKKFPILYTLHGKGAPYDTYAAMTLLQNELKEKPFIYTCFDGDDYSMYVDSKFSIKTARQASDTTKQKSLFTTFFFNEFIPAIDDWYRVDNTKRGLTGFSMGGYGALHYALVHPEMFCSVSGLSSVFLDITEKGSIGRLKAMLGPFEENKADYEALDHYKRIAAFKAKGEAIPPIYLACGTEDPLIVQSRKMKTYLESLGITIEYKESPGIHNWAFWHPQSVGVAEFHWKYFNSKPKLAAPKNRK
jgi:S-formylglutathione hydrolase FrmB